jgi:hypothetical protein
MLSPLFESRCVAVLATATFAGGFAALQAAIPAALMVSVADFAPAAAPAAAACPLPATA